MAITQWFNLFRDECFIALDKAPLMGGEGELVQFDESLFGGSGKVFDLYSLDRIYFLF